MDQSTLGVFMEFCRKIQTIKDAHYNFRKGSKQNFNFFFGLVAKTHHEKYHSNFIRYLLDPNQSHDFGVFFLKRFINQIKKKVKDRKDFTGLYSTESELQIENMKLEGALVECERSLESSGRVDIIIEAENKKDWVIFIENKFRSPEGDNQMKRYVDYFRNRDIKKFRLGIYLTTDGGPPRSMKDCAKGKEEIVCLSYEEDIIAWLESCLREQEMIRYPHITSSILQYIDAIKKELSIMEDKEMDKAVNLFEHQDKKLILLLKNKDHLGKLLDKVVQDKREQFIKKLREQVSKTIESNASDLKIVKQWDDNSYLKCACDGKEFFIRIHQTFPEPDPEDRGCFGLWWGIFNKEFEAFQCGLERKHWQSVMLNNISDFYDAANGSIAILNDKTSDLVNSAVEDIMNNLKNVKIKIYRDKFLTKLREQVAKNIENNTSDLEIIEEWDGESYLKCSFNGKQFLIRIYQEFPNFDDGGKGLWWGIYSEKGKGIDCNLKVRHWQSVLLDDVEDFNNDVAGFDKIRGKSTELMLSAAKDIHDNLLNKVLPAIRR